MKKGKKAHDQSNSERVMLRQNIKIKQMEALQKVSQDLTRIRSLDVLLRQIVERSMVLLNADAGGVYLLRPDQKLLEWVVSVGENVAPIGTTLRRGEGLSGSDRR